MHFPCRNTAHRHRRRTTEPRCSCTRLDLRRPASTRLRLPLTPFRPRQLPRLPCSLHHPSLQQFSRRCRLPWPKRRLRRRLSPRCSRCQDRASTRVQASRRTAACPLPINNKGRRLSSKAGCTIRPDRHPSLQTLRVAMQVNRATAEVSSKEDTEVVHPTREVMPATAHRIKDKALEVVIRAIEGVVLVTAATWASKATSG